MKFYGHVMLFSAVALGTLFGAAPVHYAYVLWLERWEIAYRACQCAGC